MLLIAGPVESETLPQLPFELQPVMRFSTMEVERYEMLYRGKMPTSWQAVDEAVIFFLSTERPHLPPLFVNVSNEALLTVADDIFTKASSSNDVVFELSEAFAGYADCRSISVKANLLITNGARLALDDFGAGRDGLDRFYSLEGISTVKIDRNFIATCMARPDAAETLKHLITQWKAQAVSSVAEGLETESMFDFAHEIGIEMAQGWYVDALAQNALKSRMEETES
ncbi:EAL domain-containing protein [Massilia sp. IC2-477]|uniref:EAL domain-containing protein n=1 Tax=Massilia sp. IC2-477 TaxID=2887198 RepID=UPI001D109B29|nr:EAL domain-containing protein [Massilia sp. IC2-477]MCC2958713.1 EAL domain-containing protein [Massilia sp. IC2-477]